MSTHRCKRGKLAVNLIHNKRQRPALREVKKMTPAISLASCGERIRGQVVKLVARVGRKDRSCKSLSSANGFHLGYCVRIALCVVACFVGR
jgi:hypothetical protein